MPNKISARGSVAPAHSWEPPHRLNAIYVKMTITSSMVSKSDHFLSIMQGLLSSASARGTDCAALPMLTRSVSSIPHGSHIRSDPFDSGLTTMVPPSSGRDRHSSNRHHGSFRPALL